MHERELIIVLGLALVPFIDGIKVAYHDKNQSISTS